MIDMTFCLFEKHLHMDLFSLGIFYECIEISIVFKKRDHDHSLYTSREIDWFGIKDNIKIECYRLKFWNSGKTIMIGNT